VDRSLLHRLRDGLLDLVFAPVCVACRGAIPARDPVRVICRLCWARARPLPAPNCARCWEPIAVSGAASHFCGVCASLPPGLRSVRSAFLMQPPTSEMVHALKYGGWEAAAAPMGERMAAVPLPPDVADEAVLVVPVPVSRSRLRERGYNQAEMLAAVVARASGRRLEPGLLIRTRATESQTALHPDERRANVAHAFAVAAGRSAELHREHVLLVDDVWTTGATAAACAETLLEAGARAVSVLSFARAPAARQRTDPDSLAVP
jgi:ComF family protein